MLYFPIMLQIITTSPSPSIKYASQEVTYKSSVILPKKKNKEEKEEKPPERGEGR